jgi:hypothetical protein
MTTLESQQIESRVSTKLGLLPRLSISFRKPDFKVSPSQSESQVKLGKDNQPAWSIAKQSGSIASSVHQMTSGCRKGPQGPHGPPGSGNITELNSRQSSGMHFPSEVAILKGRYKTQLGLNQSVSSSCHWNSPKRQMDFSLGKVLTVNEASGKDCCVAETPAKVKQLSKSRSSIHETSSKTLSHLHSELTKHFSLARRPIVIDSLTNELDARDIHSFETEFDGSKSIILPLTPIEPYDFLFQKSHQSDDRIKKCITSIKKQQPDFTEGLMKVGSCNEQLLKKQTKAHPESFKLAHVPHNSDEPSLVPR